MAHLREATLEDLLSDPVIQAVMASDGVRADDIRQLMKQVSNPTRRYCEISQPIRKATSAQPIDRFLRQSARGRMKFQKAIAP